MEIVESIFRSFVQLIFFPVFGALSLISLNLFSWLYVGVIGVLFAVQLKIPKGVRNVTIAALSLGIIMMWVSLFASYQQTFPVYDDLIQPIAHGGFPVKAFDYPPGAMGSNEPPIDTWRLLYLNLGFWITVGAVTAMILRKYLNNQASFKLFSASIIISLCGLGYLFAKFD